MPIKNEASTINFMVWDTDANTPKTGDSANIALRIIKDGGASAAVAGSITEPDATNMPGIYEVPLSATETNATMLCVAGKSSTSDVVVYPQFITTEMSSNVIKINNELTDGNNATLKLKALDIESDSGVALKIETTATGINAVELKGKRAGMLIDGAHAGLDLISSDPNTGTVYPAALRLTGQRANGIDAHGISVQTLTDATGTESGDGILVDSDCKDAVKLIAATGAGIHTEGINGLHLDSTGASLAIESTTSHAIYLLGKSGAGTVHIENNSTGEGIEISSAKGKGILVESKEDAIKLISTEGVGLYTIGELCGLLAKGVGVGSIGMHTEGIIGGLRCYGSSGYDIGAKEIDTIDTNVDTLLVDTTNIEAKIDIVDSNVDALLVDTTNIEAKIDIVDANVDDIKTFMPATTPIASQLDVQGIQNNTRFVTAVPSFIIKPTTGDNYYGLKAYFYDTDGSLEDPDSNEVAIQLTGVDSGILTGKFFNSNGSSQPAVASITFTPSYYRMVRLGVGEYVLFIKVSSTDSIDQYNLTFALKEGTNDFKYGRTTQLVDEAVGVATLADSDTNKLVIAKAIKNYNASGISIHADSIEQSIIDEIDENEAKIDIVDTNVDSIETTTGDILALMAREINATTNKNTLINQAVANELDNHAHLGAQDAVLGTPIDLAGSGATLAGNEEDNFNREVDVDVVKVNGVAVTSVDDFKADVSDLLRLTTATTDGNTLELVMDLIRAMAAGRMVKTGTEIIFYKNDDSTEFFRMNVTPTERTPI
jgi:hypothetical protein